MNKADRIIKVEMTWADFLAGMRVLSRLAMDEPPIPADLAACKAVIDGKLDRMIRHEYYTQYKTAPTPEAREAARQAYLDAAGIGADWRWGPAGGASS